MCAIAPERNFGPRILDSSAEDTAERLGVLLSLSAVVCNSFGLDFGGSGFGKSAQSQGSAEGLKEGLDKFWDTSARSADSQINAFLCRGRIGPGHRRDAPLGRKPTLLGGASIASGYTPSALAGALPRHPLPLKGCKSAIQRKIPQAELAPQDTGKSISEAPQSPSESAYDLHQRMQRKACQYPHPK